ncbi:hypothetical protein BHE74_00032276 [Ensete ventricosum]|uniref:Uncharacterized protein n=1 Tax=Ensete ventricosum TaxID=4639 RepID=A0A427AYF8_ENSVE|nr:hypothetical protein B296_00018407 [Ensete ventricosum]RWV87028.1 hypothetical protein GW17_00051019 [Ensete ventricosum]RWW60705.1 hypothetical protein BHE74_00032276 [Ensete ventricosum]RZR95242.1 hypothetical protein BHM03_00024096 [Ensete ventricosum]
MISSAVLEHQPAHVCFCRLSVPGTLGSIAGISAVRVIQGYSGDGWSIFY